MSITERIKYIINSIKENEILAAQLIMFVLQAAERFVYAMLIASMVYGFRGDIKDFWKSETVRAGHFVRELALPVADSIKNLTDAKGAIDAVKASVIGPESLLQGKIGEIVPYNDYKAAVSVHAPVHVNPPEAGGEGADDKQKKTKATDRVVADYVQLINHYRMMRPELGIKKLVESRELAGQAELNAIGVSKGRQIPGLIYYAGDRSESIYEAVAALLDQRFDYRYKDHTCRAGKDCTGWLGLMCSSATEVGCARLETKGGSVIIACRVSPDCNPGVKIY